MVEGDFDQKVEPDGRHGLQNPMIVDMSNGAGAGG